MRDDVSKVGDMTAAILRDLLRLGSSVSSAIPASAELLLVQDAKVEGHLLSKPIFGPSVIRLTSKLM